MNSKHAFQVCKSKTLTDLKSKGLEQFKHVSINALPVALRGAVKAGWYEGSGFFLMMGQRLPSHFCSHDNLFI
jgi:hypothetical protein